LIVVFFWAKNFKDNILNPKNKIINNTGFNDDFKKNFNVLKDSIDKAINKTKELNLEKDKVVDIIENSYGYAYGYGEVNNDLEIQESEKSYGENTYGLSYGYGETEESSYGYGVEDIGKYDELLKDITPEDIEDYINSNKEIEETLK